MRAVEATVIAVTLAAIGVGEALDGLVKLAAATAAVIFLWSKVVAPVLFQPVGRALARGARREAHSVIAETVEPALAELRAAHARTDEKLDRIAELVDELLQGQRA